jgi:hypothetical protein
MTDLIEQCLENNNYLMRRVETLSKRVVKAEAKLTKALAALDEAIYLLDPDEEDLAKEAGLYRIVTTYKELKGET